MNNKKTGAIRMNQTDYNDTKNGRNGCFHQKELQKLIEECRSKGNPFFLTDEDEKIVERIV